MKQLTIIFLAILLTLPTLIQAESFGPEYDQVVSFFQGDNEPSALDAIWDTKSVLKIGTIAAGENNNAYANHACEILYNEGFRGQAIEVIIIDIEKLAFKQELVTLGKATCE
ncbi:MAG: hypothetical protein KAU22_07665 [Desulfuromonadales bacterium]|nr:hypothetical protein [Desulfuromonadales bacterium]